METFDLGEQLLSDGYRVEQPDDIEVIKQKMEVSNDTDIEHLLKAIARVDSETSRSLLINKLSTKFGLPKRAIQKDIKKLTERKGTTSKEKNIYSANFPELIDLVTDDGGNILYLVNSDDELRVVSSWQKDDVTYIPPCKEHLPFLLPRGNEGLQKFSLPIYTDIRILITCLILIKNLK